MGWIVKGESRDDNGEFLVGDRPRGEATSASGFPGANALG
jgi:hypothetical protein